MFREFYRMKDRRRRAFEKTDLSGYRDESVVHQQFLSINRLDSKIQTKTNQFIKCVPGNHLDRSNFTTDSWWKHEILKPMYNFCMHRWMMSLEEELEKGYRVRKVDRCVFVST
ncbi:hypothetical protein Hanom_Chr15g01344241 [Helianthus anomalus]